MSMWTGAAEGLMRFLAQREVERQQQLVDSIRIQELQRQTEQDKLANTRWEQEHQLRVDEAARAKQQFEDTNRRLNKADEERLTAQQAKTLLPGDVSPEIGKRVGAQFPGIIEQRAPIAVRVGTTQAPPAAEGEIAQLPTARALNVVPESFRSKGGLDYQEEQRKLQAKREDDYAKAQENARRDDERQQDRLEAIGARGDQQRAFALLGQQLLATRPMTPEQRNSASVKLMHEYMGVTAQERQAKAKVNEMVGAIELVKAGKANWGDQAIITAFNKVTDPISVVRESEYMRSFIGQSLLDRMSGYIDKVTKGGSGLSEKEREDAIVVAREIANRYTEGLQGYRTFVSALAEKSQLADPTLIDKQPQQQNQGATPPPTAAPTGRGASPPASAYGIIKR